MREVNLKRLDLNLLVVLDALLREQHVTRAARTLGMSQPAVSRALGRLRETFADPLLVKTRQGYALSARALDLQPALHGLLQDVERLVTAPEFDPAHSQGQIRIACPDLEASLYLPDLLSVMRDQAPGLSLQVESSPGEHFEMLEQGEVDFVISGMPPETGEDSFHRLWLDNTEAVCLMRAGHPLAEQPLTLEAYLSASHGVVSLTGLGPAFMDRTLKPLGYQRDVALRLSNFLTVAYFCATTDLLFSLPARLADRLAHDQPVVIRTLPEVLRNNSIEFYLYWHKRDQANPRHRWIRNLFMAQRPDKRR